MKSRAPRLAGPSCTPKRRRPAALLDRPLTGLELCAAHPDRVDPHRREVLSGLYLDLSRHGGRVCACALASAAERLGLPVESMDRELRRDREILVERFLRHYGWTLPDLQLWLARQSRAECDIFDAYATLVGDSPDGALRTLVEARVPFVFVLDRAHAWYLDPKIRQLADRSRRRQNPEVRVREQVRAAPGRVASTVLTGTPLGAWFIPVLDSLGPRLHTRVRAVESIAAEGPLPSSGEYGRLTIKTAPEGDGGASAWATVMIYSAPAGSVLDFTFEQRGADVRDPLRREVELMRAWAPAIRRLAASA